MIIQRMVGRGLFVVAVLAVCAVAGAAQEKTISGKVAEVTDGNTVTVVDKKKRQYQVTLSGIDAPELGQMYGQQAKDFLTGLVLDKEVTVAGRKMDGKDRLAGKVLLNGRDMNLEMVIAGFAWHFNEKVTDQTDRDRQIYESAEFQARKNRFNLWSDAKPVPPWDFRAATVKVKPVELVTLSAPAGQTPPVSSTETPPTVVNESKPAEAIIGNRRSKIYHWPGCPGYDKVGEANLVTFKSRSDAEAAGYRAAKNCKAGS